MSTSKRCSYVILQRRDTHYVPAGASTAGCLLEWRDGGPDRHWRGCQDPPVVPFEDGMILRVGPSAIPLDRGEWFRITQAIAVFHAYLQGNEFPDWIRWRSISHLLDDAGAEER